MNEVENFLSHYGKKGMRWGVRKSRSTARTTYKKSPKTLTSAELEKRIKRMETEKRYNQLNRRDISKGQELVSTILSNTGAKVATTILTGATLYGVKLALTKKLGADAAAAIVKRGK